MRFMILIFGSYLFFGSVNPLASLKSCNAGEENEFSSKEADSNFEEKVFAPEMFGAIGDGKIHKLSERYSTIDAARKEFPDVKDLTVTIDGAAFQKAIDVASKSG